MTVGAIASSAPVDIYPGEHKSAAFWNATLYTFRRYGGSREDGSGGFSRGFDGNGATHANGHNSHADDTSRSGVVTNDRSGDGGGGGSADGSSSCDAWIQAAIERIGAVGTNRDLLTSLFGTCSPVTSDSDVARLLLYVQVRATWFLRQHYCVFSQAYSFMSSIVVAITATTVIVFVFSPSILFYVIHCCRHHCHRSTISTRLTAR